MEMKHKQFMQLKRHDVLNIFALQYLLRSPSENIYSYHPSGTVHEIQLVGLVFTRKGWKQQEEKSNKLSF